MFRKKLDECRNGLNVAELRSTPESNSTHCRLPLIRCWRFVFKPSCKRREQIALMDDFADFELAAERTKFRVKERMSLAGLAYGSMEVPDGEFYETAQIVMIEKLKPDEEMSILRDYCSSENGQTLTLYRAETSAHDRFYFYEDDFDEDWLF